MTRKIYLELSGRLHSYFETLIRYPPEGYEFVVRESAWDKIISPFMSNDFLYFNLGKLREKSWMPPITLIKARLEKFFKKPPKETILTYSFNHLIFRKEPWILDLEQPISLTYFNLPHFVKNKKIIEAILSSQHCKKILCWVEYTKKQLLAELDCSKFASKLEVVPRAIPPKAFAKNYEINNNKVKLLFVGTKHEPGAFEYKGGKEVLETFVHLRKIYPNLELVIRSDIPKHIRDKYKGIEGLRIIEETIPWSLLEQEFKSADIFLFPTHITPCLVFLDAMSYELPIVTVDEHANAEIIENGKTGFVVKGSKYIPDGVRDHKYIAHTELEGRKRQEEWKKGVQKVDPEVIEELVEKVSLLIENKELRKKMGKAGRKEIEEGRFSIRYRNEKLKKIFDEVIAEQ